MYVARRTWGGASCLGERGVQRSERLCCTVGHEVVAGHVRGGCRHDAGVDRIAIAIRIEVGLYGRLHFRVRLDESANGNVGHVQAAVEPRNGIDIAVRIVGEEVLGPQ